MNVYFHFPEAFDEDKKIINSFTEILMLTKKYSDFKIYYSESNLNIYKELNAEAEIYLTGEIKIIRQLLISQRAVKMDISNVQTSYIRWHLTNYKAYYCEEALISIAEKLYLNSNYNYILLNLQNGIESCRNKILVFRDSMHLNYPDYFVKIDYVINDVEFAEWLKTSSVKEFSLKDENKFQKKPSITVKGATVYYEIENKRYWHLDTFHNYIEYEVYNDDGIHIGTANEKGEISVEGKKSGRTITL
ncbi:hypothetical protein BAX96_16305 [Elizabethkingia anophelis]|uniref:hypothetical protein n=1 Tax=Elizabethkingia anophelis TaxID=1117645 RepID=UPI000999ABF4|nr:hypothetical protein [Elizabethkingia anophelis]MCT3756873.1 hypothetical protein [Elizabethkingia anophelis]MCT4252617.1 hypothetical protein [Elizabethkingia anophelis]MCT4267205.1 hypothetical protein [Elizabethkingia anophelis]MCT4270930.1 hypothetical protein [Elizabethkingia anophelis]OPC27109.1 hypothetical protein BAX96_16305 [Elizabethkingia anophelis]